MAAAAIPLVLMAAGTAISAYSSIESGQQQAQAMKMQARGMQVQAEGSEAAAEGAEFNQQIMLQNAAAQRQAGEFQADQLRLKQRRMAGTVAANVAGSGVTMTGTPLEVMNENTRLMEQDLLTLQYNTEVGARQFENQAGLYKFEAAQDRTMGGYYTGAAGYYEGMAPQAMTAGYLGAGSTLLGAGYKYFSSAKPSFGPSLSGGEYMTGANY